MGEIEKEKKKKSQTNKPNKKKTRLFFDLFKLYINITDYISLIFLCLEIINTLFFCSSNIRYKIFLSFLHFH